MRAADYLFKALADRGGRQVFLVTGGGAMHLNDALRLEKRLTPVCCHHEQACAIAAEGYVRSGGGLGIVSVTSGPGGTNAMTGVIGQWLDSIPVIYISGQVKFETTIGSCPELNLRQLGDQEINIVDLVRPVTKYAATVTDPTRIRYELEKALFLAASGRPGPVWLDIPLNVQAAVIDPADLPGFQAKLSAKPVAPEAAMSQLFSLLDQAVRPVIIGGFGIRLAGAQPEFLRLVEQLQIPVLSTFNGFDLIPTDHPLFAGRIGTLGQRAGNFVLQNADLILSIGSRNNIRQVSYDWRNTGRSAIKISVDIDPAELKKKTFVPDLAIHADAGAFIGQLAAQWPADNRTDRWKDWRSWCRQVRQKYPPPGGGEEGSGPIDPYYFMQTLCRCVSGETNIVAGNGTACVALFQAGLVKPGQHIFWNSGCASMGYDLPAAIGSALATGQPTVCLAGDGSLMMNIQELQTAVTWQLDLKIFLLDNCGYSSIRQTQSNFFGTELLGCDEGSGVGFPDFLKVGQAFGLAVEEIASAAALPERIAQIMARPGPVLSVVRLPAGFTFAPKLSSQKLPDGRLISKPLEDMFPFLERDEFLSNMIIPPLEEG